MEEPFMYIDGFFSFLEEFYRYDLYRNVRGG